MSRDALIFYSEFDDPEAWKKTLASELPDLEFHTDPKTVDPDKVHYALTWKPPTGFFARFPNLKLVTNLGAGVDSLVGRSDLPDVPISRLSDTGMVSLMTSYVLFAAIRYARDIPIFERAQRRGEWRYVHPRALSGIRVGVLAWRTRHARRSGPCRRRLRCARLEPKSQTDCRRQMQRRRRNARYVHERHRDLDHPAAVDHGDAWVARCATSSRCCRGAQSWSTRHAAQSLMKPH